jgi:Ulp1 family protease
MLSTISTLYIKYFKLPRQTNTHDCGLYMLTYIEHLLSDKK